MLIKEFGVENKKKLLFLPGAFTDYISYIKAVELLSEKWHVFLVVYDGHYEPFENSFTTLEDIAERLSKTDIVKFDLVYGFCMGGAIANLLYSYDQFKIDTLIIDAGISPYQLPHILTRLILLRDVLGIKMIRRSKKLVKIAFPPERWLYPWEKEEEVYSEIIAFLNRLTNETIRNCFDSTNNYNMPKDLPNNDTKIYYLYGELEKKQRDWDIKFFRKTYPQAIFKEFRNREHGELVVMGYKELVKFIDEIVKE